jgi:hypothetical protein
MDAFKGRYRTKVPALFEVSSSLRAAIGPSQYTGPSWELAKVVNVSAETRPRLQPRSNRPLE